MEYDVPDENDGWGSEEEDDGWGDDPPDMVMEKKQSSVANDDLPVRVLKQDDIMIQMDRLVK